MKNLFVIIFFALGALILNSCSKGNPKNTDLIGDKNRKLIVGRWQMYADTTLLSVNGVVTEDSKTGHTDEFYEYRADGSAAQYDGTTLLQTITYKVEGKTLTLYFPATSNGGVDIPAFSLQEPIRTLNETDLILHHDITLDVEVNGVKQKSRSVQTLHFKRR